MSLPHPPPNLGSLVSQGVGAELTNWVGAVRDSTMGLSSRQASTDAPWVDALAWLSIGSGGFRAFLPARALSIALPAAPVWVLSQATDLFTSLYREARQYTNQQLAENTRLFRSAYIDKIVIRERGFPTSPVGTEIRRCLTELWSTQAAKMILENKLRQSRDRQPDDYLEGVRKNIAESRTIPTSQTEMDMWVGEYFTALTDRIYQLYMHAEDAFRPEGSVYLAADKQIPAFEDLGQAERFCIDQRTVMDLNRSGIYSTHHKTLCDRAINAVVIKNQKQLRVLYDHAWMYKLTLHEDADRSGYRDAPVKNIEIIPIPGATLATPIAKSVNETTRELEDAFKRIADSRAKYVSMPPRRVAAFA